MKERPILFSGEMVRAILDGRKTQTRRIVKPQPSFDMPDFRGSWSWNYKAAKYHSGLPYISECPQGKVGDRLWVKETCAFRPDQDHLPPSECNDEGIWWKASLPTYPEGYAACHGKWRPSIFMPRWASRITLEITNIRIERLQEISEEDAKAEGVADKYIGQGFDHFAYRESFRTLWDKINGKKYPVSSNPWIWVIEFKRVTP